MAPKKTTEEKLVGPPSLEPVGKAASGDVFAAFELKFSKKDFNPTFARWLLHLKSKLEEEVLGLKSKVESLTQELKAKTEAFHDVNTKAAVLEERSKSLPAKSILQIVGGLLLGTVPWLWDKQKDGLLITALAIGTVFIIVSVLHNPASKQKIKDKE